MTDRDTVPAPPPRPSVIVEIGAGLDAMAVAQSLDDRGLAALRRILDRCHCGFCVASRGAS